MITSTRHPLVQAFRRVGAHSRRDPAGRMLLDGPRLIAEALDAGLAISDALVASPVATTRLAPLVARLRQSGARVHEASPRVVQAAGTVVTSQGIVALAPRPAEASEAVLDDPGLVLLVADGIQDPGNLGSMMRTALAADATAVALTEETADPFQPKVLRAAMGAAFRLPVLRRATVALRAALVARRVCIVVADPRGPLDYLAAPLDPPVAIVIGNEASGPDPAWAPIGIGVRIPLFGPVESLNAAAAAAVLLYEVARRRAGGHRV
ncbi:MAG: RNA methyltransferase [Armatimonadota bacterium]|nr:RNA methyltransferase [Armatimonadota bacterium]